MNEELKKLLCHIHRIITGNPETNMEKKFEKFLLGIKHSAEKNTTCYCCKRTIVNVDDKMMNKIDWSSESACPVCCQQIDSPGA